MMTSNFSDSTTRPSFNAVAMEAPQTFNLSAYCYADRIETLPEITFAFSSAGGWVTERRTVSSTTVDFSLEIQLSGILDLYAGLAEVGLELTRSAHATLTDLCTFGRYQDLTTDPDQIITLRLSIQFLSDVTLHSILMTGAALA